MEIEQQSSKAAKQQSSWDTLTPLTILGVVRTWTSAIKLLEICRSFRDDPRIRFRFTVHAGSEFSGGVDELLTAVRVDTISWERVPEADYSLVVTASESIDFRHVRGPVLVVGHGVGFHKYVPDPAAQRRRLSGLVPEYALGSGRVLLAVSHPAQEQQLHAAAPATKGKTALVGDPQFEQLLASAPHREHYRARLGIGDRRFVVLSSTWGRGSLIGRRPRLPAEVLAELPYDEAVAALVLHPNVWARYRPFQIHSWFASAEEAGLLIVPPQLGWQAAVTAADVVIGDNGSVTLLAAAAGKPVLLGAFAGDDVVPGTSAELLGRAATSLRRDRPLRPQLDSAGHRPWQTELAARTFALTSGSTERLHNLVYGLLELDPPTATLLRVPDPEVSLSEVHAFTVYPEFTAPNELTLHRFPRAVEEWRPDERAPAGSRHSVVDELDTNLGRIGNATVLTRRTLGPDPEGWCRRMLQHYPFCALVAAAIPGGCVSVTREGRRTASGPADLAALASTAYACRQTPDGTVFLRLGRSVTTVELQS